MRTPRALICLGILSILGVACLGFTPEANGQDLAGDGNLVRGMITPQAQEAIDAGLAYLATQQNADGSFGTRPHAGNVAITSLSGLAFMAGGHQPGRGRYGKHVTRAVDYVISQEGRPAGFLHSQKGMLHGPMYGHGFATLFLAEVHGMAPNPMMRDQLRGTLERAVKLIIDTQNAQGGWRYQPQKGDADISVTICQIMALRAARNAGFAVPKSVADSCTRYVMSCQDIRQGGGFKYQPGLGQVGFARSAAGVVALFSAGVYEGDAVQKGLDFLLEYKPGSPKRFDNEMRIHYYYGHYYAAQAMWTAGGRYWREWYPAIREELLRQGQGQGGHRRGDGSWFSGICPHYCTAMALIILQIPNNYLPILQR